MQRRRKSARGPVAVGDRYPWLITISNRIVLGVLCLILLLAPIPFGSARPFFLSLLAILVGVTLVFWGGSASFGLSRVSLKASHLFPAAIALAVAMVVAGLQLVDLHVVDNVFGTTLAQEIGHPIWQLAEGSLHLGMPSYVTVNPAKAEQAFLKTFLYAGVFFLAYSASRQTSGASMLLTMAAMSAAISVSIGVFQDAAGLNLASMLNDEPVRHGDRFRSTFANPNHFATFCGIGLVVSLALLHSAFSQGVVLGRGRDIALRTGLATAVGPALPGIACVLVLTGAVVVSESRAGSIAMLVGCVTLAGLYFVAGLFSQNRNSSLVSTVALIAILVFGVVFASAPLLQRINKSQVTFENRRVVIMQSTIDAISAAPLTGNGFGAYVNYYPLYARVPQEVTINRAHNDYLEVLADLGVVGGVSFLFAPAYLAFMAARGAFRRSRRGRVFCTASAAAAAVAGTHSFFDYSLQIPAVGVLLFTVLGVGVAQSWRGDDDQERY